MLLGEPGRTEFDLNFRIGDVPVRVHPFFWLVAVLLGARGAFEPVFLLVWVAVMFFSILIHELGHVLAFRYYGVPAHVVIYGLGGLAIPERALTGYGAGRTARGSRSTAQIVVSLAGPAAGFLLAALVAAVLFAVNRSVPFYLPLVGSFDVGMGPRLGDLEAVSPVLLVAILDVLWINVLWGIINLFPIYPLDGGHVSREVCLMINAREGVRQSLYLSLFAAIGLALWGLVEAGFFVAVMFGLLAYQSYQMLQMHGGGWRGGYGGGGGPW